MVRVNGRELMVDLMANPGTTYPANPASTAAFAQGPISGLPAVPLAPSLAQPIRPRQYQRSVSAASSGQVLQSCCFSRGHVLAGLVYELIATSTQLAWLLLGLCVGVPGMALCGCSSAGA